jgi:hypothetical protein
MNGAERARRRLLNNPRHRRRALIGSLGLNNGEAYGSSPDQQTDAVAETGAEKDLRIAEAANGAGRYVVRREVPPPPTEVPPADHVG